VFAQKLSRAFARRNLVERARAAAREACTADAVIWVKERVASLGAMLLKPGFKD
jgi:hypothetical protein